MSIALSNSSSPSPHPDDDIDSEYENEIASLAQSQFIMHPSPEEDREQYYDVLGWPVHTSQEGGRRRPPQNPGSPRYNNSHSPSQRPPTRNNTSSGFGKGKKRKNKVVNNKNKKNSNKNKKNRSTVKVSGRTYKVQKGPRGGKFIRRGGKKVYISSKK